MSEATPKPIAVPTPPSVTEITSDSTSQERPKGKTLKPQVPLYQQLDESAAIFRESSSSFSYDCGFDEPCNGVEFAALSSSSPKDLLRVMKALRSSVEYLLQLDHANSQIDRDVLRASEMSKHLEYFQHDFDTESYTLEVKNSIGENMTCENFSAFFDDEKFISYMQTCD